MKLYSSLCHPDGDKSCFFCCPPLRPPHYDPLQFRKTLSNIFREHRNDIIGQGGKRSFDQCVGRPINGWTCWGLGYLDDEGIKIGCLLHPRQNEDRDYRHLVDYGTKCARELCLEGRTFEILDQKTRRFYVDSTDGMDSFEYSSRVFNPVHGLLVWGRNICQAIARREGFCNIGAGAMRKRYAALLSELSYKTDGYLIERIISEVGIERVLESTVLCEYRWWKERLVHQLGESVSTRDSGHEIQDASKCVHLFAVPLSFSRFLKFSLNIWQASLRKVEALQEKIDKEVACFASTFL